jgi:hypothetical protein
MASQKKSPKPIESFGTKLKKYYQKIIVISLIMVGIIMIILTFFMHLKNSFYWCGIFPIVVGLVLMLFVENKNEK